MKGTKRSAKKQKKAAEAKEAKQRATTSGFASLEEAVAQLGAKNKEKPKKILNEIQKKVILLSFVLTVFVFSFAWAYRVNLGDVDQLKAELISADASKIRVQLNVPEIQVEDMLVEGETYQMITMPGGGWLTDVGNPQIPLFCRFVGRPPTSGGK